MKEKAFKISDLFDVQTSKSIDKGKLKLNPNASFQFIGRTNTNNGIQGYIDKLGFEPNSKDTFSVSQIGQINAQFRESEWYASQNMFILKPLQKEIIENKLYFLTCINKALTVFQGGYSSYPTKQTLPNLNIYLPVNDLGEIDFNYMTARIRELEIARIRELGAYLQATGLSDYILSEEEQSLLKKSRERESNL